MQQKIALDTVPVPVIIRAHHQARHLTLRYQPITENFILTTPKRIAQKNITAFLHQNESWMHKQIALYPQRQAVTVGRSLLIFGSAREIIHHDAAGIRCVLEETALHVYCRPSRLERAVKRYIQQLAQTIITPLAHEKAQRIGFTVKEVTFRDTRSRWGSCSRQGALSFSWRLVMAPMAVIDYVVAHEVAHLQHFDHSRDFWHVCHALATDFTLGKHWLQQNSMLLHTEI